MRKKQQLMICALLAGLAGWACSVPVFRYALERWDADPFPLVVQLPSDAGEGATTALATLRKAAEANGSRANIGLYILGENPAMDAALPAEIRDSFQGRGACFSVSYPRAVNLGPTPIWTGDLTSANVAELLASPARTRIIQHLLAGDSAVWVLLESGNSDRDEKAASQLQTSLAVAQQHLKLPEGVVTPEQAEATNDVIDPENIISSGVPLKISFPVVRIGRQEAEPVLRASLLRSEPDLLDLQDQPMAFAVFGRGRALPALVGPGINEDNIEEACTYLAGACSCQVKRDNPGFDLLLTADWDGAIAGSSAIPEKDLPPLAGAADLRSGAESAAAPPPAAAALESPAAIANRASWAIVVFAVLVGGALVLVIAVSAVVLRRNQ